MLRGMVFQNFVHFKERCIFDFSKTENGPNLFVGCSSTGKTAALELMRRCMDSKINSSLTKRLNPDENAYVFCEFENETTCYGPTVITGIIVEGKHESNPDLIPEDEEYEDWNEMQTKNNTRFHKVIMYCFKEEIKFCSKTYLEKENGNIVDLRMNLRLSSSLLDGILDKNQTKISNDINEGIKTKFNDFFVINVLEQIRQLKKIETVNSKPKLWKMMEENFVGIFTMRGPGTFQWTKSRYIEFTFKSMNYEDVCAHAEIITDLLGSDLIDKEEERRIFGYLTYPNEIVFRKTPSQTGKFKIEVELQKSLPFPLLKTSLGIIEAKQFSLLMAHKLIKTICLQEPDRGMHPHMIERMKEVLHQVNFKKTIIVATHNPYLLDSRSLDNTFIFLKKGIDSFVKQIGDLDECGIVRKIIEVEDLKRLLFSSHVLFVEGKSDKIVLQSIFTHIFLSNRKTPDMLSYEIIQMGGKDSQDPLTKFCERINIEHCFILDRDAHIMTKKENETFDEFSNRLAKEKHTFVWEKGDLEDFLLNGDDADEFTKIKEILGQEKLFANPNKSRKEKIKKGLNAGLSMSQSKELADLIKDFSDTKRLRKFLEEKLAFFKQEDD